MKQIRYGLGESEITYMADLQRAVQILQDEGCREVYLFGSL